MVFCGLPIIIRAIVALVAEFDIKADVLVSIALLASITIGEIFAAGEVAVIMQLGGLLEELTVARARAGIERLVGLTPRTARIVGSGGERVVAAEDVAVGDVLRVFPGESVPVDGIIMSGSTSINQAVMTGESLPVDKGPGDGVSSGTVNQFGAFDMRATKVGRDSSVQRMVALVQSADASKAEIVNIADRWATWVVVGALSAAALTWFVTGEIIRAVTILVVFCPCALVLATPTAIMGAIGNATKHGFLVREGDALERLSMVIRFTFDKTGTLTYGKPQVQQVRSFTTSLTDDELYALAASAELRSEHPLGRAIIEGFHGRVGSTPEPGQLAKAPEDVDLANVPDNQLGDAAVAMMHACHEGAHHHADGHLCDNHLIDPEEFDMIPGRGVEAVVSAQRVVVGNQEMLAEAGVAVPVDAAKAADEAYGAGCTVVHVAVCETSKHPCALLAYAGFIALADEVRADAEGTVNDIRAAGVEPVLLTGDNEEAASHIAGELGITEYYSRCLPQDKLDYIARSEDGGSPVCMIGDGVNDAPALKRSMVGIALGGVGSDIAADAADIVLVDDAIGELPHLLALSKHMMRVIRANLTFSMTLNFVAIILAITAVLNPVTGALVHNCGSVFVIVNSAFLLGWAGKSKVA